MKTALRATGIGVAAVALIAGVQTARAWTYWMDYTGPSGGNWSTVAN